VEEKEKNRVTISILGEEYVLRGSSSAEQMHRVGNYVDSLMKTLSESNIQMSRHKVAVLAALNLADELFKLKESCKTVNDAGKGRDNDHELV
jgi:cell division protein ZapA